jgi:hypothetical protein
MPIAPGDRDDAVVTAARAILDDNLYLTLATADAAGRPWPTPVYFAPAGYQELIWVSSPETRHSRNIAVRADVGIVVFDSRAPINTGQAVYMSATAELVPPAELDRCIDVFSRSNQDRGGSPWVPDDVRPPKRLRLYRAIASEQWVLDEHDQRIPVALGLTPG